MFKNYLYICHKYLTMNGQSAAKSLLNEKGSTTIPRKGSRLENFLIEKPDTIIKPLFSSCFVREGGIYAIITLHNNKVYVGRANSFQRRFRKHREALKYNKHYSKYLQRVYNKYGKENIYYIILENVCIANQENRELYWIQYFNSVKEGYNATLNTHVNFMDKSFIKDNVQRMSIPIYCFNSNGEFYKEFTSISEASIYFKTSSSNISRCCKGIFNHIKNHVFIYKHEYDPLVNYNKKQRDYSYRKDSKYREQMSISLKATLSIKNKRH